MYQSMYPTRPIGGRGGLAAVSLALLVTACDTLPSVGGDVQVRVENATELTFTEVRVYWEPMHTFSDLAPGDRTVYVAVDRAYSIVTVVAVTATDSTRIQVIDFVGDEPLDDGRYTFVLFSPEPISEPMLLGERVEKDS
ncbi:MAG: hypothetical protein BMS9Abin29_0164 [Gemmatimonadota bacterium]|nr:MAG: hypothetical protein BMS9Abin29_0164 [Gemmatimonadota bacterium]